jgi:hypothetical protein
MTDDVERSPEEAGVRSTHFYATSLASIGLWIRAKTVDQDERGNAERRALFVGLWPPMFWQMGDSPPSGIRWNDSPTGELTCEAE